ncbi:transposable element Tcb2 transposase [Trichonephila clavipes]|nr:transposable element Tcb2 transposase [Trichonephila clavipes]
MAVNDRTASSGQLKASWSTATGILIPASSVCRRLLHRGSRERMTLNRIFLTTNHRRLPLQWAHEHRAWQADWHQLSPIERHLVRDPCPVASKDELLLCMQAI